MRADASGSLNPSEAWRREVFNSPPRVDVEATARATTRSPVNAGWSAKEWWANGGHERTAMLMVEHLWVTGHVKRWKPQPLLLTELGGPNLLPDLLIELQSRELHVVECKAKRFITPEVQQKFDVEREFLEALGISFHVWTNHDWLSSKQSHTAAELERGRTYPASPERLREIGEAASSARCIGDLTDRFGWDDVLSAAAHAQFHFNFLEPVDELTPIHLSPSSRYCDDLFARRHASGSWWHRLRPVGEEWLRDRTQARGGIRVHENNGARPARSATER